MNIISQKTSFHFLGVSGVTTGAFYALKDQSYNQAGGINLDPSILNLPAGKTFALAAWVCNPSVIIRYAMLLFLQIDSSNISQILL